MSLAIVIATKGKPICKPSSILGRHWVRFHHSEDDHLQMMIASEHHPRRSWFAFMICKRTLYDPGSRMMIIIIFDKLRLDCKLTWGALLTRLSNGRSPEKLEDEMKEVACQNYSQYLAEDGNFRCSIISKVQSAKDSCLGYGADRILLPLWIQMRSSRLELEYQRTTLVWLRSLPVASIAIQWRSEIEQRDISLQGKMLFRVFLMDDESVNLAGREVQETDRELPLDQLQTFSWDAFAWPWMDWPMPL